MKTILMISFTWLCSGCFFSGYDEYTVKEPVYESMEDYREGLGKKASLEMDSIGRIYHYKDYQIINEVNKGIHILDNSDPANPEKLAFFAIAGNQDVAVQDDILYADSYANLVVFDFKDPNNIERLEIIENAFAPIVENGFQMLDPEKGHVKEWRERTVREKRGNSMFSGRPDIAVTSTNEKKISIQGRAGSLSRFAIASGYLYAVNESELVTVDIAEPRAPAVWSRSSIGWGLETLFHKDNNLFIGAMTGMYIVSISNPANPVMLSQFGHATSCDPVVVGGSYAYVTLRSGSNCRMGNNELNIISLENLAQPRLVATYAMANPHGLAIANSTLYICEGKYGLKIFNAANPNKLEKLAHLTDIEAIDIIVDGDLASVIGYSEVIQYRITDRANPEEISRMKITVNN